MLLIVPRTSEGICPDIEAKISYAEYMQLFVTWGILSILEVESFVIINPKLIKDTLILWDNVPVEDPEKSENIAVISHDFVRLPSVLMRI